MVSRREALIAAAALPAAALAPSGAVAADFPTRPVKLVIPWTPGGAIDRLLRSLAESASKQFGQPFVPVNQAGGVGLIGMIGTANAPPDGYTITHWAINLLRVRYMQKVSWDPLADFSYIIGLAAQVNGVVVLSESPYKTFSDYIEAARKNPGRISYSSNGPGTTAHLAMESISSQAGVQLLHVPFKGFAEASQGLLGGHVDALVDTPGWGQFVASGRVRLLTTFGEGRTKKWPNVPTAKELGYGVSAPMQK